jgi:hypothetical protein
MSITRTRHSSNAELLGVGHEMHAMTTDELVEQYDLLGEIHPALWDAAMPRFRLVLAELDRWGWKRPIRILTSVELMAEHDS